MKNFICKLKLKSLSIKNTKWYLLLMVLFFTFMLTGIEEANASHFRYGQLTWQKLGSPANTARFTLSASFRRSGYGSPVVGSIITETVGGTGLDFGDGNSTGTLRFLVISFDASEDWILALALEPGSNTKTTIDHTYPTPGTIASPWMAEIASCCRLGLGSGGGAGAQTNSNGNYAVSTIVELTSGNTSPTSSVPPIVNLIQSASPACVPQTFFVPGADPDASSILRWRLATSSEAGGFTQPPGLTVDNLTGEVSWNTCAAVVTGLYPVQIIIEDRDVSTLNLKTQIAVDFLIRVVNCSPSNLTPAFIAPTPTCGSTITTTVGSTVNFTVTASDGDATDILLLNSAGIPSGATTTPGLPLSGTPGSTVSTTFNWVPTSSQLGPHIVTFSVSDPCGAQRLCTFIINVTNVTGPCTGTGPSNQAYGTSTTAGNQAWFGELGLEFEVKSTDGVNITQLGAFDHNGDGISGTVNGGVRVAIFNKATQIIVPGLNEVIMGNTDPLVGNHRIKNIPPIVLPQGLYVIVAKGYNTAEMNGNSGFGGGDFLPAPNVGSGSIEFKNMVWWGDNNPIGFAYPPYSAPTGTANRVLAGTFSFGTCGLTADLTDLTLSQGVLTPAFLSSITSYNASVANSVSSIMLTPTVANPANATIHVNGILVASGAASGPIALVSGHNLISINITATNGASKTYTVQVTRGVPTCSPTVNQAYTSTTIMGNQIWEGELGHEFDVTNAGGILITQLGAFDHMGNGITGTQAGGIRVAVFNRATQTMVPGLDALVVGNGDAYSGNHRMKNITPVFLPQGMYVLVSKGYHAGEMNGNSGLGGGPYPAPNTGGGAITYGNTVRWGINSFLGFVYPVLFAPVATPNQILAGTFSFSSCPLPPIAAIASKAIIAAPTLKLEGQDDGEVEVYPNPTNASFAVRLSNLSARKVTLQVLDLQGRIIEEKQVMLTGKTAMLTVPFNLGEKPQGIYFIKIITPNGVQTKKIVLQR